MLVGTHGSKLARDGREASEVWLMTLRDSHTADAREELLKFIGVGRKVADCILLMSLDKVSFLIFILIAAFESQYSGKSYQLTPMFSKLQSNITVSVALKAPKQI